MKLYHGTTVPGLEMLCANSRDKNGNPLLYLTDNFTYSLFYIRDREIDFVTCGVDREGLVHYDEKFHNQLETLYRGMAGWIYEIEMDAEASKTNGIYVTRGEAKVIDKTYIPDAYEAIQTEIEKGTVEFLPFEELTNEQRKQNHEGMVRWFCADQNMNLKKVAFLRTHFPDAWEEAQNALAQMK